MDKGKAAEVIPNNAVDVNSVNPTNSSNTVVANPVKPTRKSKSLTSAVWKDFRRETIEVLVDGEKTNVLKAICKKCGSHFDASSKKGTTHLKNHIKICKKKGHTDVGQMILDATVKKDDGTTVLKSFQYDEKLSQYKLACMFILHEYPFAMIEHAGFRAFVHSLRPTFTLKCRNTIRKECMTVYSSMQGNLQMKFSEISSKLSLTMDKWTSCQNKSYLCITAHYIDDDWRLQKKIINFINVKGKGTAVKLYECFMNQIIKWNIDKKLFALTVDNDRTNDATIKLVKENLQQNLLIHGSFFHVRCAAHIINLVVQDGIKNIEYAVEKIRDSVKYIRNSPQHKETFENLAKQLGLGIEKGLTLDCSTRWNSTYAMLSDALHYKEAFMRLRLCDLKFTCCPTMEEWEEASVLCSCLRTFYDVTVLLSGASYPTANLGFEQFCEILLQLRDWLNHSDRVIASMALSMKKKFDIYWAKYNIILAVACFLDPRYKMTVVQCFFKEFYGINADFYVKGISSAIKNIYDEYAHGSVVNVSSGIHPPIVHDSSSNSSQVASNVGSKRKGFYSAYLSARIQSQPIKTDLDRYMEESVLVHDEASASKFDILGWWKLNASTYPILAKMARDILATPVSTVASESAFSTGGRVIDSYRNRLNPDIVEALICAQDWLRDEVEGNATSIMDEINDMDMPTSLIEESQLSSEDPSSFSSTSATMDDDGSFWSMF